MPVFVGMAKRKDNLARVLKERLLKKDRHTPEDRKYLIEISQIIKENREKVIEVILQETCIKNQEKAEAILTEIEEKVDALIGEEYLCEDNGSVTISRVENAYHVQKRDKEGKIIHQFLCDRYRLLDVPEIYSIFIYDKPDSVQADWEYKIKRPKKK